MEVYFTAPAQKRMRERGVESDEVEYAARFPAITWTNRSLTGKVYEVRQRGDIAAVVDPKKNGDLFVISVLWRHAEQWTDGEMFITRMIYDEGRREERPPGARR
jgi:hypothetical protein